MGSAMESVRELFASPDDAELSARVRQCAQDDPLAVLRIARIVGDTGVEPVDGITRACREEVQLVIDAPPEAVCAGLEDVLLTRDVDRALQWLHAIGFVEGYLPELSACVDLQQEAGRRHKDVWEHTKLVVKQAVRRPSVRWAALLHDIGKVPTRTFTARGVHFHGHAEVGARMFDKMGERLPLPRPLRKKIRFLIKHHLRSNQYSEAWTDSAVRRFARDMGEHLDDLLDLSRADITSRRPGRRQALLRQIHDLQERVRALQEQDAAVPPLPTGLGTAISERFGIPPSRRIGDLKRALEAAVERGELEERRDDAYYLDWLASSGLLES